MTYTKDNIVFEPKPTHKSFQDLQNRVFARLHVLGYAGRPKEQTMWWCECRCGTIKRICGADLKSGHTQSCSCFKFEQITKANGSPNEPLIEQSPEYKAYYAAKRRCTDPDDAAYKYYGGRGIEFSFVSFVEFLAEIGRRPSPTHSLDRRNNNRHYEKGNVRWATKTQQRRNVRTNRLITINGRTECLSAWCEIYNIPNRRVKSRLHQKWCISCALTLPMYTHCPHR